MPETTRKTIRSITITEHKVLSYDYDAMKDRLKYLAYAEETCPTTGKKHLQGFAYAWKPMRFTTWKNLFPTAHIEEMKGRFRDNAAYCSKEGQLIEFGEKPNENGVKSTLIEYKRKLDGGASVDEVAMDEAYFPTFCQYSRPLDRYKRFIRQKAKQNDREQPDVYVRIGPAGTGKTRWLDDTFGLDGWVQAPDNNGQWFDNCDRDVILFDDVEVGAVPPLSLWKRLTDRYPLQVPVKGGYITWKPKVIVFTSNSHPFEWWPTLTDFDKLAIERRLKEVVVVE